MKLLQSNVINQLHQAEGCIPRGALVCLMGVEAAAVLYITGLVVLEGSYGDVQVAVL